MQVLFEEDGGFKVGTVLESIGGGEPTSYHVELLTGRRVKIKAASVVLRFDAAALGQWFDEAHRAAGDIDPQFLWEVAPQDEFEAADLGAEYYGQAPTPQQLAALLLAVHDAPMYFRRKGKGRYRPAPEPELKAALAGAEKRKAMAALQDAMAATLAAGQLPEGWAQPAGGEGSPPRAAFYLFKPDKNSIEYKALDQAARTAQCAPEVLLYRAGAFSSAADLHRARFMVEWFARGPGHPAGVVADRGAASLPVAEIEAFSIDDSQTTEIDDALSVQRLAEAGRVRIGIHIAAPGLAIAPGDAIDVAARRRLSTVYMPGEKITMLPDTVVAAFTLAQGAPRPALSLYADFDFQTGQCLETRTVLERVPVAANLRHDVLDADVTEAALETDAPSSVPFMEDLRVLWQLALKLAQAREQVRGKPEPRNRTDFAFRVEAGDSGPLVRIEPRRRDAPLDRIVAEWMIFANSTWGAALADAGIAGIYRTQTSFSRPGARQSSVRMTTAPAAHVGLGVTHYAWSSSPLRRYIDLVNQWQLIAWVQRRSDPMRKPPFERNSAELFSIIGAFDAAYGAYADVQSTMERYWCLRWLAQSACIATGRRLSAVTLRNEAVRLAEIPLVGRLAGIAHLAPGTHIDVEVLAVDELALEVELRLAAVHADEVDALDELEALESDGETEGEADGPTDGPTDGTGEAATVTAPIVEPPASQ